jgi:hypothetical protein
MEPGVMRALETMREIAGGLIAEAGKAGVPD